MFVISSLWFSTYKIQEDHHCSQYCICMQDEEDECAHNYILNRLKLNLKLTKILDIIMIISIDSLFL